MITYADFILDFPEFNAKPQTIIERVIARAEKQVDSALSNSDEMIGYLAAHLLEMQKASDRKGGLGGVTSIQVQGEYSVSYGSLSFSNRTSTVNSLELTTYGLEYLRLLQLASEGLIVEKIRGGC